MNKNLLKLTGGHTIGFGSIKPSQFTGQYEAQLSQTAYRPHRESCISPG